MNNGWLPADVTQGDLDDGDFAWLSDAYTRGDASKSAGRKLPYKIHGTVNEAGWKAAWSRAHQDGTDFSGGPSRAEVIAKLTRDKPAGVDAADDGKGRAPVRQYKTLPFQAGDATDLEEHQFKGYVAAFNNIDEGGDVIFPGAFAGTLPDFLKDGAVCWQHDWTTPIGKWLAAHEDGYGLFVKGQISQTTAGKDALILLRDGVVRKMSIGYDIIESRPLSDDEGAALFGKAAYTAALDRLPWYQDSICGLTSLKLYEGSPVTFPMNPKAAITGVKDLGLLAGLTHDDHFKAVLAAVEEYLIRVREIQALRQKTREAAGKKQGTRNSAADAARLTAMRGAASGIVTHIDAMLEANQPEEDPESDLDPDMPGEKAAVARAMAAIRRERLRYEQWQSVQT